MSTQNISGPSQQSVDLGNYNVDIKETASKHKMNVEWRFRWYF